MFDKTPYLFAHVSFLLCCILYAWILVLYYCSMVRWVW